MHVYDIYGVMCDDLEAARSMVEAALGLRFVAHESGFMGGDYYLLESAGDERFTLKHNDEDEDEEPRHPDQPFLLHVDDSPRSELIRDRLLAVDGIVLLSHEELPDDPPPGRPPEA